MITAGKTELRGHFRRHGRIFPPLKHLGRSRSYGVRRCHKLTCPWNDTVLDTEHLPACRAWRMTMRAICPI
jgi:hypothetical protein